MKESEPKLEYITIDNGSQQMNFNLLRLVFSSNEDFLEEAEKELEQLKQEKPDSPDVAILSYRLGCKYLGVQDKQQEGLKFIKEAAQRNLNAAMWSYGILHFDKSIFLDADPDAGIEWLKKASDCNFNNANYTLWTLYLEGNDEFNVDADLDQALHYAAKNYGPDVRWHYTKQIIKALSDRCISKEVASKMLEAYKGLYDETLRISTKQHGKTLETLKGKDLAHYTTLDVLHKMLSANKKDHFPQIFYSHLASMDDPHEGKALLNFSRDSILKEYFGKGMSEADRIKEQAAFVICFTDKCDDLEFWRLYTKGVANGVCLVFGGIGSATIEVKEHSASGASYASQVDGMDEGFGEIECNTLPYIKKVAYSEDEKQEMVDAIKPHLEEIDKLIPKDKPSLYEALTKSARIILGEIIFLAKEESYSHESEHRALIFRGFDNKDVGPLIENPDNGEPSRVYYKAGLPLLGLKKIVISPAVRNKAAVMADIMMRLSKYQSKYQYLKDVEVCFSEEPPVANI